jgi:hypothetical protein
LRTAEPFPAFQLYVEDYLRVNLHIRTKGLILLRCGSKSAKYITAQNRYMPQFQTVLRSVITRTIAPGPATSTTYPVMSAFSFVSPVPHTFSCQLNRTLIPPPSPLLTATPNSLGAPALLLAEEALVPWVEMAGEVKPEAL